MRQEKKMVSYDNAGLSKSPGFLKALEKVEVRGNLLGNSHEAADLRLNLSRI